MGQIIKDYLERFRRYHYLGYLRHYYNAARHPHPFRFLAFLLFGSLVVFSLAIFSTLAIINNSFEGNPIYFYGLTALMYLMGLAVVPTIVLWIQGYRNREKILSSEIPDDLPQNSGSEIWYILLFLSIYQIVRIIIE
ncbi:MAG: hypothetical protein JAZ13_08305 [Candidatus Thiodiazotropha taylori]|nr:hypothetical protein [Candidatus Thiodiazotropha taylori]